MIYCYVGKPGSGKSLDCLRAIVDYNRRGQYIITNFAVNGIYTKFLSNMELTPANILSFVDGLRRPGKNGAVREGEFLLVIDEAQTVFNTRNWAINSSKGWVDFFTQHRKYGFNVILVCQSEEMIDKQIRFCIEYLVQHRRFSRFGFLGKIFSIFFGEFLVLKKWYGDKQVLERDTFRGSKRLYSLYDTNALF